MILIVILKFVLMSFWGVISSILGLLWAIPRWGNPNLYHDWLNLLKWGLLKITGVKVFGHEIENLTLHQPCIYVANHQSGFDLPVFSSVMPRRTVVIIKKELGWVPIFGWIFLATGCIPVDRKNRKKALATISKAVKGFDSNGVNIAFFPEGTRNKTSADMLPFKKGAFHMAIELGVPVVPLVAGPTHHLVNLRKFINRKGEVHVRALAPIQTTGLNPKDAEKISTQAREAMIKTYRELGVLAKAPGRSDG